MFGSEGLDFHADEHRCDVFLITGSNPWISHGMQRARLVLTEISNDPNRKLIVVDPRRHETAKKAEAASAATTKIANTNRFMATLPRTSAWHPSYSQPRGLAREGEGSDRPYLSYRLLAYHAPVVRAISATERRSWCSSPAP